MEAELVSLGEAELVSLGEAKGEAPRLLTSSELNMAVRVWKPARSHIAAASRRLALSSVGSAPSSSSTRQRVASPL